MEEQECHSCDVDISTTLKKEVECEILELQMLC